MIVFYTTLRVIGRCQGLPQEVTANATAADVTLDQAQLDALTALAAGVDS